MLVPIISLLLLAPYFFVALLVQVIVSKVHSMICQWSGRVVASLMLGAGCEKMWHGITRVHTLVARHMNECT